jgi:predicted Zn-dependent protease
LALLGLLSVARCLVWQNDLSLFTDSLLANPRNDVVRMNLAGHLTRAGRHEEAVKLLEGTNFFDGPEVINSPIPWASMSLGLAATGRGEEALSYASRGLAFFPEETLLHETTGFILANQGKLAEAIAVWEKGLAVNPLHIGLMENIATASEETGNTTKSAEMKRRIELLLNSDRSQWEQIAEGFDK